MELRFPGYTMSSAFPNYTHHCKGGPPMKLELFFDYICPYCYRGHRMFLELLPLYPGLEVVWRPCESHPRPENTYRHSDMAIQGMYYLEERGGDLSSYHRLVYEAHFEKGLDISDCSVLAGLAARCGADSQAFTEALDQHRYAGKVEEGNRYAWETLRLNAVPSYLAVPEGPDLKGRGPMIGSRDGIPVTRRELEQFLANLK